MKSNPGSGFSYAFPYGTLLAAMLLTAADERDSAVKDLDEWVAHNTPASPAPDDTAEAAATRRGKSWLVFRTMNQAMLLLLASRSSSANSYQYLALEHAQALAKIGRELLRSDAEPIVTGSERKKLPWKEQNDRVAGAALNWELGDCPGGLTESFKRAMLVTLLASNNVAFILSENLEYAKRNDGIQDMDDRAKELAKVNILCLALNERLPVTKEDSEALDSLKRVQATFFDTVATVQLALAARETKQQEKRNRLCNAYKYVDRAITLQEKTLDNKERPPFSVTGLNRVAFLNNWKHHRQELTAHNLLAVYDRRRSEASSQLAELGYTPPADCL